MYDIVTILKAWDVGRSRHWVYLAGNGKTYHAYEGSLTGPKEVKYNDKEDTFTDVVPRA